MDYLTLHPPRLYALPFFRSLLVDLRAFIMREDSPLNERMDMSGSGTTERIITKEQVVVDHSKVAELEEQLREMQRQRAEAP